MNKSENRKIKDFARALINAFGYTFQVPSRQIAKELTNICFVTVNKYLSILCDNGYMSREMTSRKHGVKYTFNRYKISKLLEA